MTRGKPHIALAFFVAINTEHANALRGFITANRYSWLCCDMNSGCGCPATLGYLFLAGVNALANYGKHGVFSIKRCIRFTIAAIGKAIGVCV